MSIYFAVSLYIVIYKGAMLCARVRVIGRACGPMGPHGAVWGAVWGADGSAMGRGLSQRGLGRPTGGLSTEMGPILRERADRASQGLSGLLSSEQG